MLKNIVKNSNWVMKQAQYVSINNEKLLEFSAIIKKSKAQHWLSTRNELFKLSKEELTFFIFIYDSINFSFWGNPKWTIKTEYGFLDGSIALLYVLLKEAKHNPLFLTPSYLKNITKEKFEKILHGNTQIPLLEERYQRIRAIGNILLNNKTTSFYQKISSFKTDKELFSYLISTFPFLEDKRTYHGKTIYFYKLAQLMTSDLLQLRALKENIKIDISNLVGCADYKLPQVIHQFGITQYQKELELKIQNKIELKENGQEETEIRAATIVVIERLSQLTNITPIIINDLIWLQGQDKSLNWKNYHLTRTTSY